MVECSDLLEYLSNDFLTLRVQLFFYSMALMRALLICLLFWMPIYLHSKGLPQLAAPLPVTINICGIVGSVAIGRLYTRNSSAEGSDNSRSLNVTFSIFEVVIALAFLAFSLMTQPSIEACLLYLLYSGSLSADSSAYFTVTKPFKSQATTPNVSSCW